MPINIEIMDQAQRKKIHDVKGALRTFESAIEELKDGSFFEGDHQDSKIAAMEKAHKILQKELDKVED